MVIIPDPRWVNTGLAAQGSWELLLLFDVFTSWQGVEFKCEVKVQTQGCWGRAKIIIIYPQREEQQEGKGGSLLLILPVNKPITFVLLCCFNERLQDTCTAPSPFLVENCGKCSEPKRTEASWVVFYIYDRGQLWTETWGASLLKSLGERALNVRLENCFTTVGKLQKS